MLVRKDREKRNMKAILEFSLPEESDDHRHAIEACAVLGAIQEYDNFLRGKLKYEELSEETYKAFEVAREKLHECFSEMNVKVWE